MRAVMLIFPLIGGYLLDARIGDPVWLYHPVRLMGRCITGLEGLLRRVFPATPKGLRTAGRVLSLAVPLLFGAVAAVVLMLAWRLSPWLWLAAETWLSYQILAVKDLRVHSMAVYGPLAAGDLPTAREKLSWIVGRDTAALDSPGIARATVETVAENTADGVVAPMLYLALGGAPLGLWYKGVNTLDSMVGYKNDRYLDLGRASALQDDAANYLPARISAAFMLAAARLCGMDAGRAKMVYQRDRYNHPSPNSASTEAVCAGALGVQLGGTSTYGGVVTRKAAIGDDTRPITPEDIPAANRLMTVTAGISLGVCLLVRLALTALILRWLW